VFNKGCCINTIMLVIIMNAAFLTGMGVSAKVEVVHVAAHNCCKQQHRAAAYLLPCCPYALGCITLT
jgi:hypothetical protein